MDGLIQNCKLNYSVDSKKQNCTFSILLLCLKMIKIKEVVDRKKWWTTLRLQAGLVAGSPLCQSDNCDVCHYSAKTDLGDKIFTK